MTASATQRRLALGAGLALAATVAMWWLGSTRLEFDRGGDTGRSAAEALAALALLRALLLALLGLRLGVLHATRSAAALAVLMLAPAWPVAALAWSASTLSAWAMIGIELALLAAGFVLPLLGQGLLRLLPTRDAADLAGATAGVLLAAAVWRGWWAPWPWPQAWT